MKVKLAFKNECPRFAVTLNQMGTLALIQINMTRGQMRMYNFLPNTVVFLPSKSL
jgi:hypothetical protein